MWDSPRAEQLRRPDTSPVTPADVITTMDMMLGALGREAVGMAGEGDNPATSPEWASLDFQGKLEVFAPIWRVMRGESMMLREVEAQLTDLTRVIKSASAESDIRNHVFSGTVEVAALWGLYNK